VTLAQFANACGLDSLLEVDKACYLAFFYLKTKGVQEFSVAEAAQWIKDYGLPDPNRSRLERRLKDSSNTQRASRGFKLKLDFIRQLGENYPQLGEKSQEVIEHGTILPEIDYEKTRGYIESLAKQINASFEHNTFDGCAVLMRRLVEVLLILSYRNLKIESAIQDPNGNYKMLEGIINDAKTNSNLALSRNGKNHLDTFRELGNFSAHKIEYTCRREYITPHIQEYRALISELLHKAGIRT
jgi:hypothetical protein